MYPFKAGTCTCVLYEKSHRNAHNKACHRFSFNYVHFDMHICTPLYSIIYSNAFQKYTLNI